MPEKPIADQFSDDDMEQIKRYGQALGARPTDFDEEVERYLQGYLRQETRQMLQNMPHLLTVTQVARYLGISRATVYRWAGTRLACTWLNGKRMVFDITEIKRYEKQHPKGR